MSILPFGEEILPLAEDFVLKAVLTHPDAKPALIDLISAVIGRNVKDVQLLNNELHSVDADEKKQRLDVNCIIDDGSQVNVEMQGSALGGIDGGRLTLTNKSIYYLTKLHSTQKAKSVPYENFVRTYQITFCANNIFKHKEYLTYATLRTEKGIQISEQINLIFIELSKLSGVLKKPVDKMTSIEDWSIFLGYSGDPDKRVLLNKILAKKEGLVMAGTVLAAISKDEHERAKRLSQEKWETDFYNNYVVRAEKALAEGIAEGKAEANTKTAKILKKAGILTNTQIAEATDLSIEEIEKL